MKKKLFNISTLFFVSLFGLSLWGQTIRNQTESNYRRIDELEAQMEEVLQKTERLEARVSVSRERMDGLTYKQEVSNH